jgi:hypothetical protein
VKALDKFMDPIRDNNLSSNITVHVEIQDF